MNLYLSNNSALAERIGEKIKELRIEVNMTQHELETAVGVSISTLKQAEKGANISLLKLIQILRALRLLDLLDPFFAPKPVSPIELAKQQGEVKTRKRVRK